MVIRIHIFTVTKHLYIYNNDLSYTVFDTGTLDGFKGAVNHLLLP